MLMRTQKARTTAYFFLFVLLVSHTVRGDDVRSATADTADLVRANYDGSKALVTMCVFMISNSSSVSRPGFLRIASSMPILPTSCSRDDT